jgi:diamine N-acetyltransferase
MSIVSLRDASLADIPAIRHLAATIWPVAYKDINSKEQLDYMLDLIYSDSALTRQMTEENQHFFMAEESGLAVGFAGFGPVPEPRTYKLHKLYVLPNQQGKGTGRMLLDKVIQEIKDQGGNTLILNVNRANKAFFFYEKLGFRIRESVDTDIGRGFYMNDYILEKSV